MDRAIKPHRLFAARKKIFSDFLNSMSGLTRRGTSRLIWLYTREEPGPDRGLGGQLFGEFHSLGEGERVGDFNGIDLFITYTGGDGNDIGLLRPYPSRGMPS